MSHPIIMTWFNQTNDALSFTGAAVVDGNGTTPTPTVTPMVGEATSSVSADQTGNFEPGPQGTYTWQDSADGSQSVVVQYHHPSGTGQTNVSVTCSSRYQISDDNATWSTNSNYIDASLQQHTAQINLYIRLAGSVVPPGPPAPTDVLIPLQADMSNKALFVNSLFTPAVRDAGQNALNSTIAAGGLVYPYGDATSQGCILDAWLAAWQFAAGDSYDSTAFARCPSQDAYFFKFLVPYVQKNSLYLSAPALTLQTTNGVAAQPPVYVSTGYGRNQFYDTSNQTWNYATVTQFLSLFYFGAHVVVICSANDLNGGNTVDDFRDALTGSGLLTRKDLYNSHYGKSGGLSGYYYAPSGAPTPSVSIPDVKEFATSAPPGAEPLLFSLVAGETATFNPNAFLQLEGWPGQDVLSPAGGARHDADYEANESLCFNFSTYGASAYSEKRSTPLFLANGNFDLTILASTGMPSYTGAGSLQDWMNPALVVNQ